MVEGPGAEEKPEAVAAARTEFVQSLGRRLEFIRNLLESLHKAPDAGERQASAQRRLHALKAAAQVLAFDGLAEALSEVEAEVSGPLSHERASQLVRRLELMPSLVLSPGGSGQFRAVKPASSGRAFPMHALVFGTPPLADSLKSELAFATGHALEVERTESLMRARGLAFENAPDVILIDYDRPSAQELIETLLGDAALELAPVVVVGSFDSPEAASGLAKLGVNRVLPKPVSPSTLRATVLDVFGRSASKPEALRGFGELTVEKLAARVASELEEGLKGTVDPATIERLVNLGDGSEVLAAVWGAIARIREVVTVRSGGHVRFDPRGPEGAIHVAPWVTGERRAGERAAGGRVGDDVTLDGRLILVADDDPAVTWFISGLLRSAGAQVMEAHDGRKALELAQRHWPDAIVSDILMPELDGFKLCRAVKGDIAVRDVPVILLSWKEDMLQRVRELGAGADGYLKKEADGSLVVQRLREVLRPRSRIEARLATGGEVKGRLGDITPRLVLQLACKRLPNCVLTVRDAAYLYEVEIRRGKPVSATRTSEDGTSARGKQVIAALLGVSAGRFAVKPSEGEVQRDFEHDLFGVLEEPIRLARGARAALGEGRLFEVSQVALDPAVLDAYMRATPDAARDVARRVAQGVPVRQLMKEGVEVGLVEAVLLDLAQHGGVRAIVTSSAEDLLPRAAELMSEVTATGEPPPVMESLEPPQFTLSFEQSAVPPEVDEAPAIEEAFSQPASSDDEADFSGLLDQAEEEPELSARDEEEIESVLDHLSEHPPAESSDQGVRDESELVDTSSAEEDIEKLPVRKIEFKRSSTLLSVTEAARQAIANSEVDVEPEPSPAMVGAQVESASSLPPLSEDPDAGWDDSQAGVHEASAAPAVSDVSAAESAAPEPAASVAPETSHESAAPEASDESAAPEASDESAAPEASDESAAPEASDGSAAPEASDESAAPEASDESAAPQVELADEEGSAAAQVVQLPTASAPPAVPRPTLDLSAKEGTAPLGVAGPVSVKKEDGERAEISSAAVEAAQGNTAPLPPAKEIDPPAKSLRSELVSGLERRSEAQSPAVKTVVMPRPGEKLEHTAPLPPTKEVEFKSSSEPGPALSEEPPQAHGEPSEAPKAVSEAPKAVSDAPKAVSEAPKAVSEAPKAVSEAPKAVSEAPKASTRAVDAVESPAAQVLEQSSDSVPIARAKPKVDTQMGLGPGAGPQASRKPEPKPEVKLSESLKSIAESARKETDDASATRSLDERDLPGPSGGGDRAAPSIGLKSLEAKRDAQRTEDDPAAADPDRDSAPRLPAARSIRFDEPRVRKIDKGPMPRLEDETPAALAANGINKSAGPKWLRGAGTIGAAAAAGLVAYFGVRMLMGPAASAETGGEEAPAAAAQAPQEQPSAQAPEAEETAPKAKAKQESKVGANVKLSVGDAPDDITLDADKGLLELNTGARHSIYVDEAFVGRGPRRRVPLGIGKHDVRIKLNGEELEQTVDIEGRRTTLFEVQGAKDEE
ncbi:MAG: response regulator [Myxococcales bacterium]|nr:response regulator [Myxococcales bacterium]